MNRQEIIEKIRSVRGELAQKYGIERLALFGSRARGDATPESDVDLVILESKGRDYFQRVKAKYFLEELLGTSVDLGYYDTIRPVIRKRIEEDLIHV
jgi:predicted nucleotidyltransferase